MENPTSQTSPRNSPSDEIRFPLPRSLHSKLNEPIGYFPPLKLGHSRDSLPPLLFPLVPTRQAIPKDVDCPEISQALVPRDTKIEELPNPRDSWSYWTGGKVHLGKVHVGEKMHEKGVHMACRTANEKIDVDPRVFELPELGSEPQLKLDMTGPGSSKEHPQLPKNQHSQVDEAKWSNPDLPEKSGNPQSALSVAFIPVQQPESIRKEPKPTIQMTRFPSYRDNIPPHMNNSSPSAANNSTPGRGNLHGERSHITPGRRSYSLTMNSHPPFRIAQPSPSSGRQRQDSLPRGLAASSRQLHRVKPGLYPTPNPLQRRYSLQRSPSGTAHSRAFEKHLLRNPSGRLAPSPNQHYKPSQTTMLYTNSYQPPHSTLSISKRCNTRSLHSNNSTNFSYPTSYSEPSSFKRRSTSSGSIHSGTGYGDRYSTATLLLSNRRNGSHGSHDGSGGVTGRMSGGSGEGVLRDFQDLEVHSEMAPNDEVAQANEGTCAVNRRPSQSPHRSNFFIPDRPTASPVRSSSYQNASEPWNRMNSSSNDMPSGSWRNSRVGLDGEVQDNGLTIGYTNSNMENPGFTTTVDAASRPYTPDQFVVETVPAGGNSTATRNPSKKSAGSWGSTRNTRRKSVGSSGSAYTVSRSSSGHGRNVLRKLNPTLDIWPSVKPTRRRSWDAGDGSLSSSPASAIATVGLGIIDAFRERKKVAKELEDAVDHPHTATTCAGPTRGIIRENSPPAPIRPDVYQPDASESRLNSLARKGKAKYEATTREIRQHIAAQNESEKARRIDALSPPTQEQGPANPGKHKNSGNPSPIKSDNTSRPGTARITTKTTTEPQATDVDAVRIKSPTSASGYIYISTVYHESQRIVEKIWDKGIGGRFSNLRNKQNNPARNLRYGSAGKKVKVYMRGARSESLTVFEKIGKNLGIRKGKASAPVGETGFDTDESDPFGIGVCGAVDVTEGRGMRDSGRWNEGGFSRESPIGEWGELEERELADPVKLKLEGEGSKKYWSSRDKVEVETTTWWGRVRNMVKK